jgi:hypothetical protein
MTLDSGSVIRALTNQNNELSVLIRDALISSGNNTPDQRNATIRDYVKSIVGALMRQTRINRLEAAQERISERTIFLRAGKRFIRLDAIAYVEFGVSHKNGKGVQSAKIHMVGGELLSIAGAHASNLFAILEKTTGDSYYDIHHLVDVSFARSVKGGTQFGYEHKESSEDNELHSADGERGPDKSGGETT